MTNRDAIVSALDALRLHKLRSGLTMLGMIIGVAAVIAMVAVGGVSFVSGYQSLARRLRKKFGALKVY